MLTRALILSRSSCGFHRGGARLGPAEGEAPVARTTGIAQVAQERARRGPCLNWVRGALTALEERNLIEATEERHTVHINIAVLVAPGSRVALPNFAPATLTARVSPAPAPRAAILR